LNTRADIVATINAIEHEIQEAHLEADDMLAAKLCRERACLHESLVILDGEDVLPPSSN
jgi:hypothetical protein